MKYFAEVLRVLYKPKRKTKKPRPEKFYFSENGSLLPNFYATWNHLKKLTQKNEKD